MTLTIHTEEDNERQLQLRVEVSEDRVEQAMRKRARELSQNVRIPGFRRGKVPYGVIIQRFGRDLVRAEAVEDMVQSIYDEATMEAQVDAYGRPSLDDLEVEPVVMTFSIPLTPLVTLGDYRALRKEIEEVSISDEAVEEAVEQIQLSHQEIESVDRASEAGDVVTASGKGSLLPKEEPDEEGDDAEEKSGIDDAAEEMSADESSLEDAPDGGEAKELLFEEESMDLLLDSERVFPGTDFVDQLIGLSSGDDCAFSITFADDYEDEGLSGRTAEFEFNVLDVKKRTLPPIDDELAKLDGRYDTLEAMRQGLREQLLTAAEDQAESDLVEQMIDDLLLDAEMIYPPVAVEMEIDELVESFKNQVSQSGWEFDDFMTLQGQTEESLREDFRETAEKKLERQLALRQLIFDEKLRIETEDVEAFIDERIGSIENDELKESMRSFYLSGSGFDTISGQVLGKKTYERIKAIYSGNAPDLDLLEAADQLEESDEEE